MACDGVEEVLDGPYLQRQAGDIEAPEPVRQALLLRERQQGNQVGAGGDDRLDIGLPERAYRGLSRCGGGVVAALGDADDLLVQAQRKENLREVGRR